MKPAKGKMSINIWMLYRRRFIFTADLFGAWSIFGGIVAQFNNLSIILHISTTECIAAAPLYDSLLSAHLEELARARKARSASQVDFAEPLAVGQTRFEIQAAAQAAKPATPAGPLSLGKSRSDQIIHMRTNHMDGFRRKNISPRWKRASSSTSCAEGKKAEIFASTPFADT